MITATENFNTTARQMTEMFQWPKCLSKKKTGQNPVLILHFEAIYSLNPVQMKKKLL